MIAAFLFAAALASAIKTWREWRFFRERCRRAKLASFDGRLVRL